MPRITSAIVATVGALLLASAAQANILWSLPGPIIAHDNDMGTDILHGAVSRGPRDGGVLYFKFRVNPLSDVSKETYYAGFQLFESDTEKLGVGNSTKAWAYSAFNTEAKGEGNEVEGDVDLHSSNPESYVPGTYLAYELPRRGIARTIVFKVQFIPNHNDLVTVWMDPDLTVGATEDSQPITLTTHFPARAKFDQIRLRHQGNGDGWEFSDMAIATSFDDFIVPRLWERWWFFYAVGFFILIAIVIGMLVGEKRRHRLNLLRAEQERTIERERSRIAQDLHDDLGASLSQIAVLCGLLRTDKSSPEQVETHANKLSEAAQQTVRALDEIVWAVRSGSDTLQSLVEYIAHFATDLFDKSATRCLLDLPQDIPDRTLPPDLRHNIFLIAKEALNNTLKHAAASQVEVKLKIAGQELQLVITDDGKGTAASAAPDSVRTGLDNMRRRASTIGGNLTVDGEAGKGTRLELTVTLPA